jgi:hypothetical protein
MLRILSGAMLAVAVSASPALAACDGDELFSDDFSDPQQSQDQWGTAEFLSFGDGYLQIKSKPGFTSFSKIPVNGAWEFDLCVDITYPEAKNPDGGTYAGVMFWFNDWKNYYYVWTTPVGGIGALRLFNDKTRMMGKRFNVGLNAGAGTTNNFQVTVKSDVVTVYGNGQKLLAFKPVAKDAEAAKVEVALFAYSEKEQENTWRFSNVRLTEPPK